MRKFLLTIKYMFMSWLFYVPFIVMAVTWALTLVPAWVLWIPALSFCALLWMACWFDARAKMHRMPYKPNCG